MASDTDDLYATGSIGTLPSVLTDDGSTETLPCAQALIPDFVEEEDTLDSTKYAFFSDRQEQRLIKDLDKRGLWFLGQAAVRGDGNTSDLSDETQSVEEETAEDEDDTVGGEEAEKSHADADDDKSAVEEGSAPDHVEVKVPVLVVVDNKINAAHSVDSDTTDEEVVDAATIRAAKLIVSLRGNQPETESISKQSHPAEQTEATPKEQVRTTCQGTKGLVQQVQKANSSYDGLSRDVADAKREKKALGQGLFREFGGRV